MKRLLLSLFAAAALLFAGLAPAQVSVDAGKTGASRSMHLLCASAVAASVTGTTTETALATCTIPAGAMGTSGGLLIYSTWSVTNSANTKTLRGKFGGTAFFTQGLTAAAHYSDIRRVRNRSVSAQIFSAAAGANPVGASSLAVTTASVDSLSSVDVTFTGQLANTGETITLENYEVWLLP